MRLRHNKSLVTNHWEYQEPGFLSNLVSTQVNKKGLKEKVGDIVIQPGIQTYPISRFRGEFNVINLVLKNFLLRTLHITDLLRNIQMICNKI